jgi:myo-inositol-1(or 4)-monophosphatase
MVSEAGGLIGNFTGEADFLYQREVIAGNPKVYGQLVQLLAAYSRVIPGTLPGDEDEPLTPEAALAAQLEPAAPAAPVRSATRVRKPAGKAQG